MARIKAEVEALLEEIAALKAQLALYALPAGVFISHSFDYEGDGQVFWVGDTRGNAYEGLRPYFSTANEALRAFWAAESVRRQPGKIVSDTIIVPSPDGSETIEQLAPVVDEQTALDNERRGN